MHLAAIAERLDLADDVLVFGRLVKEGFVFGDDLGDATFQLVVVGLLDGDLGRDLLEILTKLFRGEDDQLAGSAESPGGDLTLNARSRSVLRAASFSLSTLISTVCSLRMRLISSRTLV